MLHFECNFVSNEHRPANFMRTKIIIRLDHGSKDGILFGNEIDSLFICKTLENILVRVVLGYSGTLSSSEA